VIANQPPRSPSLRPFAFCLLLWFATKSAAVLATRSLSQFPPSRFCIVSRSDCERPNVNNTIGNLPSFTDQTVVVRQAPTFERIQKLTSRYDGITDWCCLSSHVFASPEPPFRDPRAILHDVFPAVRFPRILRTCINVLLVPTADPKVVLDPTFPSPYCFSFPSFVY